MTARRFIQILSAVLLAAIGVVSLGLWLGWSEVT